MSATRKLYTELAKSIQATLIHADPHAVALVTRAIAIDLKRDNAAFRYDRFFEACGLDAHGQVIP